MSDWPNACPACGTEPVPGASYCHRCGAALGPESAREPGASSSEAREATAPPGEEASADEPARTEAPPPSAGATWSGAPPDGEPDAARGTGEESGAVRDPRAGESAAGGGAGWSAGTSARPSEARETAGEPHFAGSDEALKRAVRGEYAVTIGEWMGRGWDLFTREGGLFIGFGAILWLVITFASPLLLVFAPVIASGFFLAALIVRRGSRLQFSDFWLPFNDFFPLFLAWLIYCAFLFAGLLTCGVVTVYLWVAYQFVYLLILDRGMDFWDALEVSRRAVTKHWFGIFALVALLFLVNILAFLVTFSLGIIVSIPLTSCILAETYACIFGVQGRMPGRSSPRAAAAATTMPPPQPPPPPPAAAAAPPL
jgi:hypothetical protein